MSTPIVPAVIPSSKDEVLRVCKEFAFTNEIQIDVVDGEFVKAVSWPYSPAGEPISVKPFTDAYTLEVDLMVANPILAARDWIKAGADMLVFHIEGIGLEVFKNFAENTTVSVGVSMSGDTKMEDFLPYVAIADDVQLMGIESIGAQGQPFDEKVLDNIQYLRKEFPGKLISIDGSVNKETIRRLKEAGATRFVSGSAIVKADNPEEAFKHLNSLVNG